MLDLTDKIHSRRTAEKVDTKVTENFNAPSSTRYVQPEWLKNQDHCSPIVSKVLKQISVDGDCNADEKQTHDDTENVNMEDENDSKYTYSVLLSIHTTNCTLLFFKLFHWNY